MRVFVLMLITLLLNGCKMSDPAFRIGTLVLLPSLLLIGVLLFLYRRGGEDKWKDEHYPDADDDDDDENHYLM